VFTCPICVSKTLAMLDRLEAQTEMFEVDTSPSLRSKEGLVSVSAVLTSESFARYAGIEPVEDGLPF